MERQATEWKIIFSSHISGKGRVSRIYKMSRIREELSKLNNKTHTINKWTKYMNRPFTKGGIQMADKPMKRCPTSVAIRRMQIKTKMRQYTPIRISVIKKKS